MENSIIYTSEVSVSCKGEQDSGHPLIYLNLQREGRVACPYCGVVFVYRGNVDECES